MPLRRGHRLDDGLCAHQFPFVEVVDLLAQLSGPGHHPEQLLHRPQVLDLLHLGKEVFQIECLVGHLLGHGRGLFLVEDLLGLFDKGKHIAHIQDPAGHPIGVEHLEIVQALSGGGEQNGTPCNACHGECRTTAGVAIELGDHDSCEIRSLGERLSCADRILAGHRVNGEQHLVRVCRPSDVRDLLHQLLIDAQTPRGVDDDHIVLLARGEGDGVAGHRHGVAHPITRFRRIHGNVGAFSDGLQLVDGVRTLQVSGDEQRGMPLAAQPRAQFPSQGGLTRALKSDEQDDGRAGLGEGEATRLSAQDGDQLVMDDFHDLLSGVECLTHFVAESTLAHPSGEVFDDAQRDIGIQESTPDFSNRRVDVRSGELAA